MNALSMQYNNHYTIKTTIHETAEVSDEAFIGLGTQIWHQCQINSGVAIGNNCVIGKGVFIDHKVRIGDNVKIQNRTSIFLDVIIENNVNIEPHVCFSNSKKILLNKYNGKIPPTLVKAGATIGEGTVILPGVVIGAYSIVGQGSIVTQDIPDYSYVQGNPAVIAGYICECNQRLVLKEETAWYCSGCDKIYNFQ
ncbi:acyltransferase [Candidatus Chlorohelix sp.]|uniref:acyltransferase n=1 Tax=Candidatus Chlorohelix sp. TaxID=3139201 RepID=UPI00314525E5